MTNTRFTDFVNDARFTQSLSLPADPALGRTKPFRITYADFGYRNATHPEEENVLLFFGPLMASRLVHITKDHPARAHKIRVIHPDRPGFGGTDAVDAKDRLELWLEAMPALLAHLGITHISAVGCQSGGTVYALDFLLHHPELLDPSRPACLAIGGPWILPSHTGSVALSLASMLPASLVNQTDKLTNFIGNHVAPVVGTSAGISSGVMARVVPASWKSPLTQDDQEEDDEFSEAARFEQDVWPTVMKRMYSDGIHGISAEAVMLLQKADSNDGGGGGGWSDWGDYDELVPLLADALRAAGRTLRVDVYYAETDMVVGPAGSKGPVWFDRCWDQRFCAGVIDFHSRTEVGADHDSVWGLKWTVVREVFERVGSRDSVAETV
ncbi:hypothetical protein B0H63DRAFT_221562 [Podospora didyma]|uniref:AB hydrolase-1 domain-containing protein n=1 Tax=Podospora didyma TaxID=330526 RepID=A0AAE0KJF8_9PEZI|nr:hypothetical protein B0H63DRAFT_221562 [Podospora didyma]